MAPTRCGLAAVEDVSLGRPRAGGTLPGPSGRAGSPHHLRRFWGSGWWSAPEPPKAVANTEATGWPARLRSGPHCPSAGRAGQPRAGSALRLMGGQACPVGSRRGLGPGGRAPLSSHRALSGCFRRNQAVVPQLMPPRALAPAVTKASCSPGPARPPPRPGSGRRPLRPGKETGEVLPGPWQLCRPPPPSRPQASGDGTGRRRARRRPTAEMTRATAPLPEPARPLHGAGGQRLSPPGVWRRVALAEPPGAPPGAAPGTPHGAPPGDPPARAWWGLVSGCGFLRGLGPQPCPAATRRWWWCLRPAIPVGLGSRELP